MNIITPALLRNRQYTYDELMVLLFLAMADFRLGVALKSYEQSGGGEEEFLTALRRLAERGIVGGIGQRKLNIAPLMAALRENAK